MSYEWRFRPLFIDADFLQCPHCHLVSEDHSYSLRDIASAMPCCGATGEKHSWPDAGAQTCLAVVRNRDSFIEEGENIRFTFLASMLEALLEPVVFRLLAYRLGETQAEKMLQENYGAWKLRRLFNKHSHRSLEALFTESEAKAFPQQWSEIARLRNQFAHGKVVVLGKSQKEDAEQVEEAAFRLFVRIHNDVVRQTTTDAG